MTKTLLRLFLIASIFTSCTATYNITVHKDGSATVETWSLDSTTLVSYSNNPIISGLDTSDKVGFTFVISDVDSLGNYLTPFQPGFIQFRMDSAALTITDGHGNAFSDSTGRSCCGVYLDIEFDEDIRSVNSANKLVQVSDTNSISIVRDKKDLRKGRNRIDATIKFGQTDSVPTREFGKWGGGLDVGGGMFLSGASKGMINDGLTYINAGLTVSYSKFHFMLQTGGMAGSLKRELAYSPEWKQGNRFSSTHHQLSVGYELLCTRHFNILPFASGGMVKFSTPSEIEDADWIDTRYAPMYSVGAAFDFKINAPTKKNREPDAEYETSYYYFRLMTGVYPGYFQNPLGMKGAMCFVNLSVGFYGSGRRGK